MKKEDKIKLTVVKSAVIAGIVVFSAIVENIDKIIDYLI